MGEAAHLIPIPHSLLPIPHTLTVSPQGYLLAVIALARLICISLNR